MDDFFSECMKDEMWLIKETEWVSSLQSKRESQFAIGNGYIGARGILEDIPQKAQPGFYIAGIYDKMGSLVEELVNLPNPINFKFTIDGQRMDMKAMDVLEHKRILNMKKGVLLRDTIFKDTKKRRYEYQSIKFMSMKNKNIGVMRIKLTPLDGDGMADVHTGIDTSVTNGPFLSEGNKRHFRVRELGQQDNAGYLVIETLEKTNSIVYWSGFYYETGGKKVFAKDNIFRRHLKKNKPIIFTKIFHVQHFPYNSKQLKIKTKTQKVFNKAFCGDYENLLTEHVKVWQNMWKRADIVIKGTANLQQNLRFNIYHMLICGHEDNGFSSVGARTLSGEGYRGHVFWDGEIFLFPFYLFTFPNFAKNMLLYRYNRLDKARELARNEGYLGVKFAWESGSSGDEQTPAWARDIDGNVVHIHTQEMEHHITADIAYAFYQYYTTTKDEKFMEKYGYEVLFETARFWASRVKWNNRTKKFDIPNIIGPDEFHLNVTNNAFTNIMARWNLRTAYHLFSKMKRNMKVSAMIKEKLSLTNSEAMKWGKIAEDITVRINKNKVIEQFDGYYKLQNLHIARRDENGIPVLPKKWSSKDFSKTQLVKQADVLMALYLLDNEFDEKVKIANYNYYSERTMHSSSLSPGIHAIMGCRALDMQRAYSFFNVSLRMDISNLFRNTHEGVHAASLGATWQAVVFGFAGIRIHKDSLSINPIIPNTWPEIAFTLKFGADTLHFKISHEHICIKALLCGKKSCKMSICNKSVSLNSGKWVTFNNNSSKEKQNCFQS